MRTKQEPMRTPTHEELEFIRLMESYGRSELGIKVETLCKLIFVKELDEFHARELRYYRERYQNYLYQNIIPIGKIIARNGVYKLIDNEHALKEQMQYKALNDLHCALIDFHNTQKIYGKIECKGQQQFDVEELINFTEEVE